MKKVQWFKPKDWPGSRWWVQDKVKHNCICCGHPRQSHGWLDCFDIILIPLCYNDRWRKYYMWRYGYDGSFCICPGSWIIQHDERDMPRIETDIGRRLNP